MKKIQEPSFTNVMPEGSFGKDEDRIYSRTFTSVSYAEETNDVEYHECIFRNVSFRGKLEGCTFADVIFDHCDLSNCDMSDCNFRRVLFDTCRMMGTNFSDCVCSDVRIKNCQCAYINLNASQWKISMWENNLFCEGSISDAKLKDLQVKECDFSHCEISHTPLQGIDLSDSEMDGLAVTAESLKGVIVNTEQAVVCAKLLGVIVKE